MTRDASRLPPAFPPRLGPQGRGSTREESALGSPGVFQRDAFTGNYRLGFKRSYLTWPLILCHKEEKIIIALIPSKSGAEFRFNLLYPN